jgi:hypothetical protein
MAEMHRRAAIMGEGPITDQANPKKVSDRDYNPFFYDPEEYRRITQPLPSATPLSTPQP